MYSLLELIIFMDSYLMFIFFRNGFFLYVLFQFSGMKFNRKHQLLVGVFYYWRVQSMDYSPIRILISFYSSIANFCPGPKTATAPASNKKIILQTELLLPQRP
jgi:hypothetical protein